MNCDNRIPNAGVASPLNHTYASSVTSSASSSSSSVFSAEAVSSQASTTSSSSHHVGWEAEDSWTVYRSRARPCRDQSDSIAIAPITRVNTYPQYQPSSIYQEPTSQKVLPPLKNADVLIPLEQRQHHRRSSISAKSGAPPTLTRQADRKVSFVDRLVYSATQMVEVIWPLSVPACRNEDPSGRGVLPLRVFIEETLRRSKTSYSTLQVALYYLVLIKSHVPRHDFTMEQPQDGQCRALQCGRRMFLAALILASKYLQDRNYSARAWSKISGLKVCEINTNEMAFLQAIDWKLHIPLSLWERWQEIVFQYAPQPPPSSPGCTVRTLFNSWRTILPHLTPDLNTIELAPRTPTHLTALEQASTPRTPYSVASPPETPTPIALPRFLEPKPDMLPPTPSLARMRSLPTPVFTPQANVSSTPAVSAATFGSRRPSMCSAMAQAQGSSLARCTLEWNPSFKGVDGSTNPPLVRRPSIAVSTTSSSSSPESMVSDNSSRSSRASSISSVSSAGWAPNQPTCLARLATCRSARLPYPATLPKTQEVSLEAMVTDSLSPTLESLYLDEDTPTVLPLRQSQSETVVPSPSTPTRSDCGSVCSEDPRRSRKRGRSSVDLSLQQNVRHLLKSSRSTYFESPRSTVVADRCPASSFLLSAITPDRTPNSGMGPMALQSPKRPGLGRRLPVQKDLGRKRTCCASEAAPFLGRPGPGMWEGVL